MILNAARLSLANLFAPETRGVFWKVIGLTLLALIVLWFGLRETFIAFAWPFLQGMMMPDLPEWAGWLTFVFGILASIGLALGLALLLAPVTAIIAGFFLDDVAEVIEKRDYPAQAPGRALPMGQAIAGSVKFLGIVILGNLLALFLLFIPGINLVAFFLVNGYLLGREFFEFAAMRHRPPAEARLFRAKHAATVLMAGLLIAAFLAIPVVNLLTPLFAAGLMVHLHKALSGKDPGFSLRQN
ncbi:sulfate transporter family protein [Shinella yambaruensis]|uniref:Cysteine biosynthesis protein n=1 Tax=Shinella yambaruensis TaxID=415996 RepID=A0ABQ5ZG44_9HYPH|nr:MULTISPECIES: sulfate transporter family protein [Shinella]MCJ8029045.1 sulfate transporter family protein [Shinella yambaruensis]MCU7982485.1 sulfate transporter family protein [Shinella yambaruensis]MCW5707265.1 sulfate transporter family protein [Shinella sp.]GLR51638.1 cysteine biosynthesis protein [Shinella yambaruensis]